MNREEIHKMVERYYSEKIKAFGPVPMGVDWNGAASQELRFAELLKINQQLDHPFSILDFGCGYGAMLDYVMKKATHFNYTGFDISKEMIVAAELAQSMPSVRWTSSSIDLQEHDYVVASGIFNVREQIQDIDWEQYIFETLSRINSLSKKGFAFNMLSLYSDVKKRKDNLYYASPVNLFHYCKSTFSNSVALLHDYPLYEFTILVRKDIL